MSSSSNEYIQNYGFPSSSTPIQTSTSPSVHIHTTKAGTGPPLLLLHGYPQNLLVWHRVAPALTSHYTVIAMDLRGYGRSSKPADTDDKHTTYSKRVMADDCVKVMRYYGFDKFFVCGHDRGGRVAHKLCVLYPSVVRRCVVLDIAPTMAMYSKTDFTFAKAYYHWFFLIQASPLPETLISNGPQTFIEAQLGRNREIGLLPFAAQCLESYVEGFEDSACVHATCEDYRASAGIDLEEARQDEQRGRWVGCPLMVLWGKKGVIEGCFDARREWEGVCRERGRVVGEAVDCGHYIPEEKPEVLVERLRGFLRE